MIMMIIHIVHDDDNDDHDHDHDSGNQPALDVDALLRHQQVLDHLLSLFKG